MNNSMNYQTIRMNNESIVIVPGSKFTKNELKSRLHSMDIDANDIQDKNSLINLYESTLSNNYNKFKIFKKLREDTEIYNSKLGLRQRESILASNNNTMPNNSKNNIINTTYEVKPFNSNNIKQHDLNIIKSNISNISKGGNSYNTNSFINSNNEVLSNIIGNLSNNNHSLLKNSNKNTNNYLSINNNYSIDNNISQISKNNRFINNTNKDMNNRNILNNRNNSINNINNKSSNEYYQEENKNKKMSNQNYREEKNTGINRNNNSKNSFIENSSNDNSKVYTQNPEPNYQKRNQSIFHSMINNNSSSNNFSYYNKNNNTYSSYNPFNDNKRRVIIEDIKQSSILTNMGEDVSNNHREPDEQSNYSIFSNFKDFKNSPLYKNRKKICLHIAISFLIVILVIGGFYLLSSFWDTLTDPGSIINGIFGFIGFLFFGFIRYFYITIPLIILLFLMFIYLKKYLFKNKCEQTFNKILEDLMKNERNSIRINEDDIFINYFQNSGIKYEKFVKKYLPILRNMRRDNPRLKSYSKLINGKTAIYWELLY